MADMWDIARYVEDHPDNHEQRWRLAKKLYMAWEYRLALEHLQILKKAWPERMNVVRYLAATYYRLGRHEEAIAEIQKSIGTWPNEIALREQLARVLEVAGRREEAAATWDELLRIQPGHPIAERAAQRLRARPTESPKEKLNLADSDSGIDLRPGRVCPNCGAQNSDEFDRCWQCHAPLREVRTPTPRPISLPGSETASASVFSGLAVACIALLLGISTYFTVMDLLFARNVDAGDNVYHNLTEFLHVEFATTRAIIGVALLLLWPLAILVGLRAVKAEEVSGKRVALTGLFLASLTYAATWLPGLWFAIAPLAGILASLVLVAGTFPLPAGNRLIAWAVQIAIVIATSLGIFVILEGTRPFTEATAISRLANEDESGQGTYPVPAPEVGLTLPLHLTLRWTPTGSVWLDSEANTVLIEVDAGKAVPAPTFEFKNSQETLYFGDLSPGLNMLSFKVTPSTLYEVIVKGPESQPVTATVRSVLRPRFEGN